MRKKYLPIGTVVQLKNTEKKVMITGFYTIPNNTKNVIFDYSGCMYPEGFLSNTQTILFNHSQIEEVFYIGYENDEEIQFKKSLDNVVNISKKFNINLTQTNTENNVKE